MSLKVMSLCSGIGGLELALQKVFNMELVGVAETNPTASNVLDERFGVKNYGDITDARKYPRLYGDRIVVAGFP